MKAMRITISAALAITSISALASIPPSIRVVVLSPDDRGKQATHAYLRWLEQNHHFSIADGSVGTPAISDCVGEEQIDRECVRSVMRDHSGHSPTPVTIIATAISDEEFEWECLGPGVDASNAADQKVIMNLKEAMFGSARRAWMDKAHSCLGAARAEAIPAA